MSNHRAQPEPAAWRRAWEVLRRKPRALAWLTAGVIIGMLAGGTAWAVAASNDTPPVVTCDPATVGTDGTFNLPCKVNGLPAPSPSSLTESPLPSDSPSPSASPSPSSSPSPSPSTSPTPSPSPSTSAPGACPVAGKNVPGAADPWGGCFPGPGNTGVPAGVTLTNYTGPCTITVANTVIDSKHVTCTTLSIKAAGVVLKNSWFDGVDIDNGDSGSASFTITDSKVSNGGRAQCACIGYHSFTATRVEVVGGNRGMYCVTNCVIRDSWVHGQVLIGLQHGSGIREEQYGTIQHNTLTCDYVVPAGVDPERSCSSPLTGYADFAPIHDNTIKRNLFLASPFSSFCMYGGATGGKPFSSDPLNGTHQQVIENVFQRGANKRCGDYGPITDFDPSRVGNVYAGNVWDSGQPLTNADL